LWELPAIRSRLSPQKEDSVSAWHDNLKRALRMQGDLPADVASWYRSAVEGAMSLSSSGAPFVRADLESKNAVDDGLMEWLRDSRVGGWCNHDSRGHMASDLHRYLFAAAYAQVKNTSPTVREFPKSLWPSHRNLAADDPPFLDRFRVQLAFRPSTTVVSHIAKDGHYFIHPDPSQARSLTVREAARLQTFPDNYFFEGQRTDQFTQVGNAVPPFLARQLAEVVSGLLRARAARPFAIAA
jgi:DNA (cytosine-5)-methyltransferase 1